MCDDELAQRAAEARKVSWFKRTKEQREAIFADDERKRKAKIENLDATLSRMNAERDEMRTESDPLWKKRREARRFNASFGKWKIANGTVHHGLSSWPAEECAAVVDTGANIQKMSAGRVVFGAVALGPVGAVLGGLAKKNKTRVYMVVTVPGDSLLEELPVKDEGKAKKFAHAVNQCADFLKS